MTGTPSDDIARRLLPIFATVLKLPEAEVHDGLAPANCAAWDSLNHIHLVNGIEEEFSVMLEFDEQMNMTSYAQARATVLAALTRG